MLTQVTLIHSEINDDPGPRTSELISASITPGVPERTGGGGALTSVDDEGFSVRPQEVKTPAEENSFDSSSDSDSGLCLVGYVQLILSAENINS